MPTPGRPVRHVRCCLLARVLDRPGVCIRNIVAHLEGTFGMSTLPESSVDSASETLLHITFRQRLKSLNEFKVYGRLSAALEPAANLALSPT